MNWPGKAPAGKVVTDLIDASDLVPTFADRAGAKLPEKQIYDGQSFAPQIRGEHGLPRQWIFNQLANRWYVRDDKWRLNESGQLFDMTDASFAEMLVSPESQPIEAGATRRRLQVVLNKLNPAAGIQDGGDGTGRHKSRKAKGANLEKQWQRVLCPRPDF